MGQMSDAGLTVLYPTVGRAALLPELKGENHCLVFPGAEAAMRLAGGPLSSSKPGVAD